MSASESEEAEAREFFDKARDRLLLEWATTTISAQLGAESTGYIAPAALVAWAERNGVIQYVPAEYRKAAA